VGWSAAGPTEPFVDVGPLRDGAIYRQACDWKALGVGAPTIADPGQTGPRFAVEKPLYAADGQTAQADINFVSWAGPGTQPFLSVRHCALRKVADHWRLIQCRAGPIT
jgi:hypothetical protein